MRTNRRTTDHRGATRVLIVDDERPARENLKHLLTRHPEIQVVGVCKNGIEAGEAVLKENVDIVFLDVQMPGMDGFEVIRHVGPGKMPLVVFVTAYDRYAIRAFEAEAVDYLLKPFSDRRFDEALERARESLRKKELEALTVKLAALVYPEARIPSEVNDSVDELRPLHRFEVKTRGRTLFLRVDEIDWIEAADYYVKLHCQKKEYLVRITMKTLQQRLEQYRFVRIHRSILVNALRIRELLPSGKAKHRIVLEDGAELIVSRRNIGELKKIRKQWS